METVTSKYVGRTEYSAAWEEQKRFFNALLDAKRNGGGQAEQVLLFVEHPHVYTLGKSGHASNLLVDDGFLKRIGATYFQTDRGGDITYHGLGQLVGYPILDLERLGTNLKDYIWTIEESVIRTIAVKASRYVTMHGFALNVTTDLRYFSYINPCGFVDKGVTSIEKETGMRPTLEEVARKFAAHFGQLLRCEVR